MNYPITKTALLVISMSLATLVQAQNCDKLHLDITKGTLNGVKPTDSQDKVKEMLPCFTGETEEGSAFNFGGGVFYLDHDFYFYTHRDYLEVRREYPGTMDMDLIGASMQEVMKMLGKPKRTLSDGFGSDAFMYKRKYGTLRLSFRESDGEQVVAMIGIHKASPAKVYLED